MKNNMEAEGINESQEEYQKLVKDVLKNWDLVSEETKKYLKLCGIEKKRNYRLR